MRPDIAVESTLSRLQAWYAAQCNGAWEHANGVSITSCDNPGWWVKVNLAGTTLEMQPFPEVGEGVDGERHQTGPRWFSCRVEAGTWHGAGDESQLERILDTFLQWTERHENWQRMNLNQVTLPSTDVKRAARFYRELGFVQIVDSAPRYARFECPDGGATFSLHQVDSLPGEPGVTLYFECPDLDRQYEALVTRGVRFESPPTEQPWLWREAYLRDPDGNRLCLYFAGRNRRFPPWRLDSAGRNAG